MKKILFVLFALSFALTANAQVTVDDEGDCCIGNGACFVGFDNSIPTQWSGVSSSKLNVDGGISIAIYDNDFTIGGRSDSDIPFSIAHTTRHPYVMMSPVFYITEDGAVYSRKSPVQLSDSTMKTNISPLTSTLSKIQTLNGVSYNYIDESNSSLENAPSSRSTMQNDVPKHIGLLAQEVELVYPEVVRTFSDGSKGIMYTDLVAVLVEGMKEMNDSLVAVNARYDNLQNEVDNLKEQLETLMQCLSPQARSPKQNSEDNNGNHMQKATLYQNTPNPFNNSTEIAYRLTSDTQAAAICTYNLNGKMLRSYPLQSNAASGKIQINASDFEQGMYIYALVIDGRVIDSKRMIMNH